MIDTEIKNMTVGQIRKICQKYWPPGKASAKARCDLCPILVANSIAGCVFGLLGGIDARRLNKKYKGRG